MAKRQRVRRRAPEEIANRSTHHPPPRNAGEGRGPASQPPAATPAPPIRTTVSIAPPSKGGRPAAPPTESDLPMQPASRRRSSIRGDQTEMRHAGRNHHRGVAARRLPIAIAAALGASFAAGNAVAFEIDTGNPELSIRWDNTARVNYAVRVEERDDKIGNSPIADEGTYSFDDGDAVAERIDI